MVPKAPLRHGRAEIPAPAADAGIKESTKSIVRLLLSNPQAASLLQAQTLGRSKGSPVFYR